MIDENETKICQKCNKLMKAKDKFYTYKNGEKTELCKDCLTMHIDNFDPSTFLWLLEKMDVPYVETEWNVLRDRAFAKNPNLNGTSVFGKYLSKMKLKQWNNYGWADTERLKVINDEKNKMKEAERQKYEASIKKDFEEGKITESEYKTLTSTETLNQEWLRAPIQEPKQEFFNENNFIAESELAEYTEELTQEDKVYLAMKWGRLYQPAEWVELEKGYNEMMQSFDIQDADTINTLILLCKTNLKMNQALDCGDVEGFQKLAKVSESLRKTAKFTAAQNKEEKSDFVDSVGELVAMCEREGFIPRYATDIPQDKVDLTLKDMEGYLYKLVTKDLGFGQQIEDALKKIQIQKEIAEEENEIELDLNGDEIEVKLLNDEDYVEYYNTIEEQISHDKDIQAQEAGV